jgi:hypothetical protein
MKDIDKLEKECPINKITNINAISITKREKNDYK